MSEPLVTAPAPGSWKIRRRVMFTTLLFDAAIIIYALWLGADTKVNEAAITMAFISGMSIIGAYVFGAVWNDNAMAAAAKK